VGHNGSGKTTLLKLMTKVMHPYAGRVDVAGSVGGLIEVTAGIHPDLSGRENIILYGSLLGVPRKRMTELLEEIVAFAELENALDRLVKFYSWGMKMRLGFAVAAFLEPDVLLVDEVLAVGDSRFQQKCLTRMRQVLENGTTIVFVSHDLAAIEALCSRGVLLEDGVVKIDGPIRDALGVYRGDIERQWEHDVIEGDHLRILSSVVTAAEGGEVASGEPTMVELTIEATQAFAGEIYLGVSQGPSAPIFLVRSPVRLDEGKSIVRCELATLPLPADEYALWLGISDEVGHDLIAWRAMGHFPVHGDTLEAPPVGVMRLAPVQVAANWTVDAR
jgi:ABC-2 type transport system ATP-binding protein